MLYVTTDAACQQMHCTVKQIKSAVIEAGSIYMLLVKHNFPYNLEALTTFSRLPNIYSLKTSIGNADYETIKNVYYIT